MKTIALGLILIFASEVSGQNDEISKNNLSLEERINRLQDSPEDSLGREISQLIVQLHADVDSLKKLVQLRDTELLLYQSKLKQTEKNIELTKAELQKLHDEHGDSRRVDVYYVVIESERTEIEAKQKKNYFATKLPGTALTVVKNEKETWFHVCVATPYDRGEIGSAVKGLRDAGYKDAWWIYK